MMRMKKMILITMLLLAGMGTSLAEGRIHILPFPQQVEEGDGDYCTSSEVLKVAAVKEFKAELGLFKQQLKDDRQIKVSRTCMKKADVRVVKAVVPLAGRDGSYRIRIDGAGVLVEAYEASGAFYGLQSLAQMVRKEEGRLVFPQCRIEDWPMLSWRSFMLDEGRSFKGMEVVKQLMDDMARLKMNVFQWHLTDDQGWRIEIRKYPRLTEIGSKRDSTQIGWYEWDTYDGVPHEGFYTRRQIREILDYAAARHITVVPEIEMPGHSAAAVAAYPWLSAAGKEIKVPCKFGVQYNVFNPADPKVLAFLKDVLDEVMDLFPSQVVHIGGDEVRYDEWKNSPMVQEFIREHELGSPAGLQVWFTNHMAAYIESKGHRMMGWNDITGEQLHDFQTETSEVKVSLSPEAIVQFWSGDYSKMARSAERGNDILNSFNEYTYLDYSYEYDPVQATYNWKPISLKKAYLFNPVPEDFPEQLKSSIIGSGCQMWGEWIPTVEKMNYQVYPRIAAYAEAFWLPAGKKDYDRFKENLQPFLKHWEKHPVPSQKNSDSCTCRQE